MTTRQPLKMIGWMLLLALYTEQLGSILDYHQRWEAHFDRIHEPSMEYLIHHFVQGQTNKSGVQLIYQTQQL